MAPAREHLDLVGDTGACRVDQVEERDAKPRRGLLDADDLFDCARAPASCLHSRVIGHHGDLAGLDRAQAGHHAVGRQLVRNHVREQAVLDERAVVEQETQPFTCSQLVLLAQLRQVARPTLERLLPQLSRSRVRHCPLKSGSRFSKKALMPSRESSVCETSRNWPCR